MKYREEYTQITAYVKSLPSGSSFCKKSEYQGVLDVLWLWNDYLLPSLILGKKKLYTLPLSTYTFYGTYSSDLGKIMAGLVLTILPVIVIYLILQKQIISGVVAGAVKA